MCCARAVPSEHDRGGKVADGQGGAPAPPHARVQGRSRVRSSSSLRAGYAHPRFIMLTILIALLLAAVEADRAGSVDVIGAVPAISSEGALRFRQREP